MEAARHSVLSMPSLHRGGPPRPYRRPRPHHFGISPFQKKIQKKTRTRKTPLNSGLGRPKKNPEPDTGQNSAQSTAIGMVTFNSNVATGQDLAQSTATGQMTVTYNVAKTLMMDATGHFRPFDIHLIEADDPRYNKQSVISRTALWRLKWRDFAYAQGTGVRWTRLVLDAGAGPVMMHLTTTTPLVEDVGLDEVFLTRAMFATLLKGPSADDQVLPGISTEESRDPSATYVKQQ